MRRTATLLAFAAVLLLASAALAEGGSSPAVVRPPEAPDTSYEVSWWAVDGGGGNSAGGAYALSGSAGQAEGSEVPSGGGYQVTGGFWGDGPEADGHNIYLPLVLRRGPV